MVKGTTPLSAMVKGTAPLFSQRLGHIPSYGYNSRIAVRAIHSSSCGALLNKIQQVPMKAMVCRFTVQREANMISCSSVLMPRGLLEWLDDGEKARNGTQQGEGGACEGMREETKNIGASDWRAWMVYDCFNNSFWQGDLWG